MIDGILFILLIINLGITLTLYFRYHNTRDDDKIGEIREEMSGMIARFNQDAERNIELLEDKIRKTNTLIKRLESSAADDIVALKDENKRLKELSKPVIKQYVPPVLEKKVESQTTSLEHIIERANEMGGGNPSIIKSELMERIIQPKKSFIQKAYNSHPADDLDIEKTSGTSQDNALGQDMKSEDDREKIPQQELGQKEKTHQIARLIGEGKSLEEISSRLGLSLGETQLITSLLKKRLAG